MPIRTDDSYAKARITSIDDKRVRDGLANGKVVVITGFQGVTDDGHITTLGRGGSGYRRWRSRAAPEGRTNA